MSIVHVPVTKAVKKYILKEYSNFIIIENDRQLIQLHRKYFLGNFLASLMTDNLTSYKVSSKPDVYVSFKLSRGFEKSYVPEGELSKLSYHLEHLFKNEFCKFLGFYHSFGLTLSEAMDNFYDHYNLTEDDYSRDAMRRYYNRYGPEGSEWQEKKQKKVSSSRPDSLYDSEKKDPIISKFQRFKTEFAVLQEIDLPNCTFLSLRKQMLDHINKDRP